MSTKHNFQIRMDRRLFLQIKALAEQQNRSISKQIQHMLNDGLKRENADD